MRMYAVRNHGFRAPFFLLLNCRTQSVQLLSSLPNQEHYSKLLITELKTRTHNPQRAPVKIEDDFHSSSGIKSPQQQNRRVVQRAVNSGKEIQRSLNSKSTLSQTETEKTFFKEETIANSSLQHHIVPIKCALPLRDEAEQYLHDYFDERSVSSITESVTPVSSLLSTNQSIPESVSILRCWFRTLDLNGLNLNLPHSGNLAPYVHSSYILNQMVRLGVDLSKLESIPGAANMLVKLDFKQSIEPVIWKLYANGFSLEQIARLFTVFPKVLRFTSEEIDTRIRYFLFHNFIQTDVVQMISQYPTILGLSLVDVDRQLANVQTLFQLSADELRQSIVAVPKIILHPLRKIKDVYVVFSKMMGFSDEEVHHMVCENAKLLVTERDRLVQNFMFMHSRLDLPLDRIQQWPTVLSSAPHLLSQRATFLVRRGLLQPDPTKPLYTPLSEVVNGDDAQFCKRFGFVDEDQYNIFLKTL